MNIIVEINVTPPHLFLCLSIDNVTFIFDNRYKHPIRKLVSIITDIIYVACSRNGTRSKHRLFVKTMNSITMNTFIVRRYREKKKLKQQKGKDNGDVS